MIWKPNPTIIPLTNAFFSVIFLQISSTSRTVSPLPISSANGPEIAAPQSFRKLSLALTISSRKYPIAVCPSSEKEMLPVKPKSQLRPITCLEML